MSGTAKHYISLFTGAGGLDIGFNEAGFHGLLASDIMPQANETFILNYPDEPYLLEDIRTLSISEIKSTFTLVSVRLNGLSTNSIFVKSKFFANAIHG